MKIVPPKEKKCAACGKKKTNTCETVSQAQNCKELKTKTNASTDKTS